MTMPETQVEFRRNTHGIHLLSNPEIIANPSVYQRAIRGLGPVFFDDVAKVWVCSGYPEALEVLRDHKTFRSARLPDAESLSARGMTDVSRMVRLMSRQMLFIDPPAHTAIRTALQPAFAAAAVAAREEQVREIVRGLLTGLPEHGVVDLVEHLAGPLPTLLIASRLGLRHRVADVLSWADMYDTLLGSVSTLPHVHDRTIIPALLDAAAALREEARGRRGGTEPDMLTALTNALAGPDLQDESLPDALDAVAANCLVVIGGGYQTLTHLVAGGIALLSRHPDQIALIRANPGLIGGAIDETMRLDGSSQYVARQATGAVELGGKRIEAGQSVVVLLAAANLDPRQFPDPERFDITRLRGRHLGFAIGPHHCMGRVDAEQAARVTLLEFLERYHTFGLTEEPIVWGSHGNTRSPARMMVRLARTAETAPVPDSPTPIVRHEQRTDMSRWFEPSPADVEQLRSTTNLPVDIGGGRLWMDRVADVARRHPDTVAVEHGDHELTYGELDRAGDALAGTLQDMGVEPARVVGVFADRGIEAVVGVLGVGRAGGAFLTSDSLSPPERVRAMFAEARIHVLCTVPALETTARSLAPANVPIVVIDLGELRTARRPQRIVSGARAGDTAYVIFTSGTTGGPKAVSIDHEALVNVQVAQRQVFRLTAQDRLLQWFSPNFDGWPFDLILALTIGARLVLAPNATACLGRTLLRFLRDSAITIAILTPTVWRTLPDEPLDLPALRLAGAAGEVATAVMVDRLIARHRRVLNLYGPTEAAVWTTWYECRSGEGDPPIGEAIVNKHAYIFDTDGSPAAAGVPGELWVGGMGIGRYVNRPGLMRERFRPDPLATRPGQLMYGTGDLCRWRTDGRIEYLGRLDRQVKIRGQRVELEEIERVLSTAPGVGHAAVALRDGRLVATVVGTSVPWDEVAVRAYLRSRLHSGMIPAVFNFAESPRPSGTGKLNLDPPVPGVAAPVPPAEAPAPIVVPRRRAPGANESDARRVWQVARLFAACLRLPQRRVRTTSDFFDLGGDSLSLMELLTASEDQFGVALEVEAVVADPSPAGIAHLIAQREAGDREMAAR